MENENNYFKGYDNNIAVDSKTLVIDRVSDHSVLQLFAKENQEILRFERNGDIFLHGKLIENDKQVVDGFKEFLKSQGCWFD